MALLGTLKDTFTGTTIDTAKWTNWGTTHCTQNNQLTITTTTAAAYFGMDSVTTTYDMTASVASVKMVNAGNQALTSLEVYPVLITKDANNTVSWLISGGNISCQKKIAGVATQQGSSAAYSSSTHKYFRIREAGGTVYWDYSTDSETWTNQTSITVASLFAVTSVSATIITGNYAIEASTTTAVYDDFNVITYSATATFAGTGAFAAAAPAQTFFPSATFAGIGAFAATAVRTVWAGTNQWINETGASGNYISTPSIAAFAVTDLDLRWEGSLDNFTTVGASAQQYLISNYTHLVGGYKIYVSPGATDFRFQISISGSNGGLNAAHTISNGKKFRLRVTRIASTGVSQFYMGTPETAWLSLPTLGSSGVVLAGNSIPQGTTAMQLGNGEGSVQFAGNIYYGEVRNGIDGTVVSRFNPQTVQATGARLPTTVVDSTGTWTMNGSAWSWNQVWAPVNFAGVGAFAGSAFQGQFAAATWAGIGSWSGTAITYDAKVVPTAQVFLETTAGVWVDVTADFQQGSVKRGKQAELDKNSTGGASLQFINSNRKYDPLYTASPLYGYLDLRHRMKVLAVHAGITYPVFLGYIDSIQDNRVLRDNAVITTIKLSDYFKVLNKYTINGTSFSSELSGTRVNNVLNIIDATSPRNIDAGATTLQSGSYASTLLSHAQTVALTEFGDFYIQADGKIRFKGRDAALTATLYGTYGDGVGEHHYKSLTPSYDESYIRNPVNVDRNGGISQSASDSALYAAPPSGYGRNQYSLSGTYHNSDPNALSAAQYILARFKKPQRRVVDITIGPVPYVEGPNTYPEILSRELTDNILVRERPMGLGDMIEQTSIIEGIEHTFSPSTWTTKFNVAPGFAAGSFWTLGVSTLGSTTVLYF